MEKAPLIENPRLPRFYLFVDGDDFGGGDGARKAFLGPTLPRRTPLPSLVLGWLRDFIFNLIQISNFETEEIPFYPP